jgi:acyl-CoA synthetase (AMP-forming)/AMP-acid ligase II
MSAFDLPSPLLPDLIEQHGRWHPDKAAVREGDRTLTWAQFDGRTNRFGQALLALGLGPGSRVAILMANSLEMVEAMFGALKAGVSVVPLNLSVNDATVAAMITDSSAVAVVASGEHCSRIDALQAAGQLPRSLLRIGVGAPDPGWQSFARLRDAAPALRPPVSMTAASECNIIYSSGTTAQPKGIVHSHGCRLHWANDLAIALRYHSGAVTLCSLGLYSNISWVAMLSTFLCGGTVVIMPSFSARSLTEHIARYRVTHGAFVPVQLQRLLELDGLHGCDFSSLQAIMCCGSPLPPPIKRAARDLLACELIELYGLTEGIVTTLAPEDFDGHLESVGKPIPGQSLCLVGDDDKEAAVGTAGEIVGYGRLVMDGYHNRPEATAEATWIAPDGKRWLRTGDIGRLDDQGFLHIVDRKKDMILSGGQNIYPADIEAVVRVHQDVGEVAVIGMPDATWGETPLAVVVPRPGADLDAADIVQWTNSRVGKQQRLSAAVVRASLPRNPNGKILKRELRAEYAARRNPGAIT